MGPDAVPIVLFVMTAFTVVGFPIARAFARRIDAKSVQVPDDVSRRLERMEQALDSVAVEVERISEGQRFTTRLLSERSREGLPAERGPER